MTDSGRFVSDRSLNASTGGCAQPDAINQNFRGAATEMCALLLARLLPDALTQSALTAARRIAGAIFIGQLFADMTA
jgi:hypothetical protein